MTYQSGHPLEDLTDYVCFKVKNIGFDRYIGAWILWIHYRYIGRYFYMNFNISEINKNILKLMEILCKA